MAYTVIGRIRPCPLGAWSAERAYETLDVVMSADGRRAYMAAQSVPAGTALENAAYWAPIVDVSAAVDAANAAAEAAAEVAGDVAQLRNDLIQLESTVKEIQAAIESGGTGGGGTGGGTEDALTVSAINDMLVSSFENRTVSEVEA